MVTWKFKKALQKSCGNYSVLFYMLEMADMFGSRPPGIYD